MSVSEPFLRTSDRDLAATLYCLGFDITGIDKSNIKRVIFYFKKTPELEDVFERYFNNQLIVNPLAFGQAQREIMAKVHTDIDD